MGAKGQYAKRVLSMAAAAVLTVTSFSVFTPAKAEQVEAKPQYPFMDTALTFEERAADLVSRLTLDEKISQLGRTAAAVPRLGLAKYDYWNEALHGIQNGTGEGTSFPQPLSMAQTWDTAFIEEVASAIADECRGHNQPAELGGRGRGLTYWCPTINLDRSPLWGRTTEAYGEDAFVAGMLASAFVDGMQGDADENGGYLKTVATIKHYALNNHENGRGSTSSDTSEADIRDYYTKVFRYVVENTEVASLMSAYNAVNNTPSSGNTFQLMTLLRKTFGFTGFVTSDCGAIGNLKDSQNWKPTMDNITLAPGKELSAYVDADGVVTKEGSVALAMMAGCDMDCGEVYPSNAKKAYNQGLVTESQIEINVYNSLLSRFKLGEFDPDEKVEYRSDAYSFANAVESEEHRALADEAANKSVVLLKNDGILPLDASKLTKVVVVGDQVEVCDLGNYSGKPQKKNLISMYDGISDYLFTHNKNVKLDKVTSFGENGAIKAEDQELIKAADAVIVLGSDTHADSSEGHDREELVLTRNQNAIISNVGKLNANTVLYLQTSNMVELKEFKNDVKAILWSTQNGQSQGVGMANQIFGEVNPSGKLTFTWFADEDQIPGIRQYGMNKAYGKDEKEYSHGGWTYQYSTADKEYAFGYGLSYTNYEYSNVNVNTSTVDANGKLTVTATIKNAGQMDGSEVVQVYVKYPQASNVPDGMIKQIKGFAKVDLAKGESKNVSIDLDVSDFCFWDGEKEVVPAGEYTIEVGASSEDIRGTKKVTVTGALADKMNVLTATPSGVSIDMAQANAAITTDVTIAMKNDMFLDNSKATITYKSSDETVAKVDATGKVTGVNAGVATITVTAQYGGETMTASYPVAVKAGLKATGLKVAGKDVENFDAMTTTYNVAVKDGKVPDVSATAASGVDVKVVKATSVPGVTTVTLTKGEQKVVYTVNFVDACDITAIEFPSVKLTTEQAKNYKLDAKATLATCDQSAHKDQAVTYTYKLVNTADQTATATLDGDTLKVTSEGRVTVAVTASYNGAVKYATAQFLVSDKVDRSKLEEAIRVKLAGDDFDPETLNNYYKQIELAREVFFNENATQAQVDKAYEDLMAVKDKLVDRTYVVANYPDANATHSFNNDQNIYVDWKKSKDAENKDVTVDFTTHKADKLELRFKVTVTPTNWDASFDSVINGAGSWIKLRSNDQTNKADDPDLKEFGGSMDTNSEHNYGWAVKDYIKDWGTTEVVIPLADEDGNLPVVTKGMKPDGTHNTSRGKIDWSEMDRFFMIIANNKAALNNMSYTVKLEDVRVVDKTLEEQREELNALLTESVKVEDCKDQAKVTAYEDAFAAAEEAIKGENVLKIINAKEALIAARDALGVAVTVNKTALKEALDAQVKDLDRYTAASVAEYKARIKTATDVYEKADATQIEVNRAVTGLADVNSVLQLIKVTPYVLATLQDGEKEVENHYLQVQAKADVDLTAEKDYTVTVRYDVKLESTHPQTPSNNDWLKYVVNGKARAWYAEVPNNDNGVDIAKMDCSKDSVMTSYTKPGEWMTITQELPVEVLEAGKLTQFDMFMYNDTHNYATNPDEDINWNKDTGVKMTVRNIVVMSDRPTGEEPSVDKSLLNDAIAEAEDIDTTLYTDETVADLNTALTEAKKVANDAAATQAKVNEALDALNEAMDALEKKPVEPDVDYGNVNGKDGVTAEDALLVLQASTQKITLSAEQTLAADVDGKDGVTATDALLILQFATKKIASFPVEAK